MRVFAFPRRVYWGEGSLGKLADIAEAHGAKVAAVVTDRVLRSLGLSSRVVELLSGAGVETRVFDEVEPEPSFETVRRLAARLGEWRPQMVVAVGGGSVMDAAKAAWAVYETGVEPEMINPFQHLGWGRAVLVAVPTTAGTGSEATYAAVLTEAREGRRKFPVVSHDIVPHYAVLDPGMVRGMPRGLALSTGLDTLAHALEAYVSTEANPLSDGLAEEAFLMAAECLEGSVEGDADCRGRMMLAAFMAGLAFSNSGLGLAHSLGHALGSLYKTPHGLSVALFLPHVVEYNSAVETAAEKYGRLAARLGEDGSLAEWLRNLYRRLGAPLGAGDLGVDYSGDVDRLVDLVFMDPDTPFNPRQPSVEDVIGILERALKGGYEAPPGPGH